MQNKNRLWIGGKHSVELAILSKKRKLFQVVSLKKNKFLDDLKIKYEIKTINFFNKIFKHTHIAHQGLAALVSYLPNVSLEEIQDDDNIIVLDGITDPGNIGAIIRSSVAFGIKSIIVKDREFNEQSQVMVKTSSGSIEEINICRVPNLTNAIQLLKKKGFWTVCLAPDDKNLDIYEHQWDKKNIIILGSEGDGVKALIKKNSDYQIKIKIHNKKIESLNVSNAAAIVLHHLAHQKK